MGTLFVTVALFILLAAGCAPPPAAPTVTPVSGDTAESTPAPQATQESDGAAAGMATSVAARTPIPTPTPSGIERRIDTRVESMGLDGRTFLGLTIADWADLALAAFIILVGYFAARLLVNQVLKRIAKRLPTEFDDEFLNEVSSELRWLVVLLFANYAVSGLAFLSDTLRTILNDIIFLLGLALLTAVALGLIRTVTNHYVTTLATQKDKDRLEPVITAIQRFAKLIVLLLALSIGLAHYGANANALYLTLLVSGLIVSLAARDVIADALAGFIILVDQPFRVGDSILIKELDTWGDVLDIGTRN
jgi:small-conductance mechanosensitive channel